MLERARRRAGRKRLPVTVRRVDATRVPAPDGAYDAVFDFGIVHHVEDWPAAVAEVRRVLRPGGRFFFEEVTAKALTRPSYRLLFEHPRADRFSAAEFIAELDRNGLRVDGRVVERFFGDFVIGAARANA